MDYLLKSTVNGVTTLTMNNPKRLNGWTMPMLFALKEAMEDAAAAPDTKVVVLTGTDPYYSAGVNLAGTIQLSHPRELHEFIRTQNQSLFDLFITFPKPILIAVNGPAIGAVVTSATLCDAIIASEKATFSTPFAALKVPHEGCSSEYFPRILGQKNATRMLDHEGWKPNAQEALEIGLVQWVAPHDKLMEEAQQIAEGWIEEGRVRTFRDGATAEELKDINAAESVRIADAFLGAEFIWGQYQFLLGKKKYGPAAIFFALWLTRPFWSQFLP